MYFLNVTEQQCNFSSSEKALKSVHCTHFAFKTSALDFRYCTVSVVKTSCLISCVAAVDLPAIGEQVRVSILPTHPFHPGHLHTVHITAG